MRYRKRIKIAPGLNINLSKRGVSATLGPRGANVNVGRSGAYLNTGLPGTGLYNRRKIADLKREGGSNSSVSNNRTEFQIKVDLDDEHKPVVEILDDRGNKVTSPTTINKIKRTAEYRESIEKLYRKHYELINGDSAAFTDLYKLVSKPVTKSEIEDRLYSLKPKRYSKIGFNTPKPTKEAVEHRLQKEAEGKFTSILFWRNKRSINEYVADNLNKEYSDMIAQWEREKRGFEQLQQVTESEANDRYLKLYEEDKKILEGSLEATEYYVVNNFEALLKEIDIEPEFFVDYEYSEDKRTFYIDLDLPEIEDLPTIEASLLKSGRISVKDKTGKQLREDYARCVTGLGLLVASVAFNASVGVMRVEVGAYTQRVDKSDGHVKDDYIYSVEFDRETFSGINFELIDPVASFQNFNHQMELTTTFIFRSVKM